MFKTLTLTALAAAVMFSVAPAYAGNGENGRVANGAVWNGWGDNGIKKNGGDQTGNLSDAPTGLRVIAVELPPAR